VPCWWSKCSAFARNVIHKISHCSGKRYISNSWDQIWIYVCLYFENNIERTRLLRTRVFMTPTGKKPFDHLNILLADYATITKRLQIMKLMKKQSTYKHRTMMQSVWISTLFASECKIHYHSEVLLSSCGYVSKDNFHSNRTLNHKDCVCTTML